ncbi:MAG: sigma-70 family RNA polymerase sigma factor [Alphaproteobacteria bacterium]|nr:sigma-70 family RNA polymerase sigma factor [Alphaproteobacteria bacterium]
MTVQDLTDEEIMRKTALGDEKAFHELLTRYEKRVFALAWRLCFNQTEAEDLTQETFLKVWKNAALWRPEAKLETWIYRVLHNLFIDSRRRDKGQTEELSEDLRSDADTPEQTLIKKRTGQEVAQALNALPDRQKEALILCYYQGMKAKDAAEFLSVSQGALEALLFRARQALKDKLSRGKGKNNEH